MISKQISKSRPDDRKKGVLLPLFSLPSKYGIGCISEEAYRFIDWLADTGHSCWQMLPLGPTGDWDSPYQPLSSFAGNAYYIDPCELISQGLLSEAEADAFDPGSDPQRVDYESFYDERLKLLRLAYERFNKSADKAAYCGFCDKNKDWLDDYSLFMALREKFGRELIWDKWPEPLRRRDGEAIRAAREECAEDVGFYTWTQFEFYRQWAALKQYAGDAGISLIGDMPIYVSYDSADCWACPEQFRLNEDLKPLLVAGVPPDNYAADGQLWGNPLYDWEKMKDDGYSWWISRIRQSFVMYDIIRLDHFRGYEAYFAIPADAESAAAGWWVQGPGMEPFRKLMEEMHIPAGENRLKEMFIAEDLGFLTDGVRKLLSDSGLPGTKVLQFGFDGTQDNPYLPERYPENCVVYTGTHDNDTTVGWFEHLEDWARGHVRWYLGLEQRQECGDESVSEAEAVCDALIEKALMSRADLCIVPLQDYLHLGSEARVNVPGTVGDNWRWRMMPNSL